MQPGRRDGKPEGVAKGEKPPAEKGENKDGGKNGTGTEEAKATPKEDKSGDGAPKANDKPAKKDDAGNSGEAKSDKPGQDAKPEDVAKKVQALKDAGRKSALFLLVSPEGENRFVPLTLQ